MLTQLTRPLAFTLAGLALAAGASAAIGDDGLKPRYAFATEPLTYRYQTISEQTTSNEMFGDSSGGMKQIMLCTFKSTASAGEDSDLEIVYTGMKMLLDQPGGKTMFFDSKKPVPKDPDEEEDANAAMTSKMLAGMIGKPFSVTANSRGKIIKLGNVDIFRDIAKDAGGGSPAIAEMLDQMFGSENLKNMFGQIFIELPEGPIKQGATWSTSRTAVMPFGGMKQTFNWTYAGDQTVNERTLAKFTAVVAMEILPADPNVKLAMPMPPGMEVKVEKDATGTMVALFDTKAGFVRSAATKLKTPITMTFPMPAIGDQPASKMKMAIKSSTNLTMALVANDAPLDPDNIVTDPDAPAPPNKPKTDTKGK